MTSRSKWLVYEPTEGWELYESESEARDAWERMLDWARDEGGTDGWPEDIESAGLYRAELVTGVALRQTATADDQTEDGEKCRERGWDYMARLEEVPVAGRTAGSADDAATAAPPGPPPRRWQLTIEVGTDHLAEALDLADEAVAELRCLQDEGLEAGWQSVSSSGLCVRLRHDPAAPVDEERAAALKAWWNARKETP